MSDNHLEIAERYQSCQTEEELKQIQWVNINRYFDSVITGTLINFCPEHYQYMTDNPLHDVALQRQDYLYQALCVLLGTNKKPIDIINIILHEQIANGIQQLDGKFADFVIKKYVKLKKIKLPKNSIVQDILDNYKEWLPEDTFLMIRLTGQYEFFNTQNGKFYSHSAISNLQRIWHACTWEVKEDTESTKSNIVDLDEHTLVLTPKKMSLPTVEEKNNRLSPKTEEDLFGFIDTKSKDVFKPLGKWENSHFYIGENDEHFIMANANPAKRDTQDFVFRGLAIFLDVSWEEIAILNMQCYLTIGKYLDTMVEGEYAACEYLRQLGFVDLIDKAFNSQSTHEDWIDQVDNKKEYTSTDIQYMYDNYPAIAKGRGLLISGPFVIPMVNGKMIGTEDYTKLSMSPFIHYWFVAPDNPVLDTITYEDININSDKVQSWLHKKIETKKRERLESGNEKAD